MPIIAKWPMRVDGVTRPIGSVIELSEEEEQRLVDRKLAIVYQPTIQAVKNQTDLTPHHQSELETITEVFTSLVKKMKKPELLAYGTAADVPGADESLNVEPLRKLILTDTNEKGVDLDALTDEQLRELSQLAGIEVHPESGREEVVAAIDAHFGTVEDDA